MRGYGAFVKQTASCKNVAQFMIANIWEVLNDVLRTSCQGTAENYLK